MNQKIDYPYQQQFEAYLNEKKHYSPQALFDSHKSVSYFWNFFINSRENGNSVADVNESDVRAFLVYSSQKRHLASRTVNKYLVYLRQYFTYLFEYQGLNSLPTISIRQLKFNKVKTVIINVKPYLPEIIANARLSDTTKKAIVLVTFGVKPESFVQLRFNDIKNIINDKDILNWLKNCLNFSKSSNPFIFSKKNGEAYKDAQVIHRIFKQDQKNSLIKLTYSNLKNSYIYTIVSNSSLSDDQIYKKLNIDLKTLTYYKNNLRIYKLIDYKDLRDKKTENSKKN